MKTRLFALPILTTILIISCFNRGYSQPASGNSSYAQLSGTAGAYFTGERRNMFARLLGKDSVTVNEKIDSAFTQLFFGNDSTQRVYYTDKSDTTMAYIEDIASGDVRTEGMSYGMMIAVQMDRKDVFDKLWKWAKTYMQVQSGPHNGYFAWHCRRDGTIIDPNAASDGEEWFVMSLFFASGRWSSGSVQSDGLDEGNGAGIFDYEREANKILNTMLHKEDEPGHERVTNMFDRGEKLVVFVPVKGACEFTDPSYQVPHYYELWSRWAGNDNEFWEEAAEASRRLLKSAANPETGLCPDYSHFDGKPVESWPGGHSDFRFDAWRVAMNVAMDYVWFAKDEWQVEECNKLLQFFTKQGIEGYGNQFTLDGKQLGKDHSTGLVAMNAVAAMAGNGAYRRDFVEALWNAEVPSGFYRYYDGMLYMLGLLQVSGNFRIYTPAGK